MLHKTKGIVLHTVNYSETSIIVKMYTELFGLQSYLVNGARSKKAKIKSALFQPLNLLDMIVYHKEKGGLQRISEARTSIPFASIPYDISKNSIALFLDEILYKSIREEEVNNSLFQFIYNSICILDLQKQHLQNFHLFFMMQLSKYLGFFPLGNYSKSHPFFNLKDGTFDTVMPSHPHFVAAPLSEAIDQLIFATYETLDTIRLNKPQRKELLLKLIEFFELHLPSFGQVKSHHVLEVVMD